MKLWNMIRLILGIAAMGLLLNYAGIGKTAEAFTMLNLIYLPAIMALFVLGLWMGAYNLKLLSDAIKKRAGMGEMFRTYLQSWAFGMIIPGKLGEFSFVYLSRKWLTTGEATAISVLDKLITVITLCALAFTGLFIFFTPEQAMTISALTTTAGIIGTAAILMPQTRGIIRKLLGRYGEKFAGFSKTLLYLIFEERKAAFLNLSITLLKWCLTAILTYLAFKAFGQDANLLMILSVSSTAMLLSLIPITMSGLGIKEAASVFLYGAAGIPHAAAISVQIILLMLNYLGAAAVFLLLKEKRG